MHMCVQFSGAYSVKCHGIFSSEQIQHNVKMPFSK